MLNRDDILKADDLPTQVVEVPEWGGAVRVRGLTGQERDKFEASVASVSGKMNLDNVRARMVALVCIDDKGKRIFSDKDVAALGQKSGIALDRIFEAARKLSGIGAGEVEVIRQNFTNGQNENSTSG